MTVIIVITSTVITTAHTVHMITAATAARTLNMMAICSGETPRLLGMRVSAQPLASNACGAVQQPHSRNLTANYKE